MSFLFSGGIICGPPSGIICVPGSFAFQFGDHYRSRDHLLLGSFAALYSCTSLVSSAALFWDVTQRSSKKLSLWGALRGIPKNGCEAD